MRRQGRRSLAGDMQWLLDFAAAELGSAPDRDLVRWRNHAASMVARYLPGVTRIAPLSDRTWGWITSPIVKARPEHIRASLEPAQAELRRGLNALQGGHTWKIPPVTTSLVSERGAVRRVIVGVDGTPLPVFLSVAADTIAEWWASVRACQHCGRPFVPRRRDAFGCSVTCNGAIRWARFAPTRVRDFAGEYERRQRKRTGPKVRIKRRKRP